MGNTNARHLAGLGSSLHNVLTGFYCHQAGQTLKPKSCLQAQERQKAELHFKLAMALQFAEKPEQALKEIKVGPLPCCAGITCSRIL